MVELVLLEFCLPKTGVIFKTASNTGMLWKYNLLYECKSFSHKLGLALLSQDLLVDSWIYTEL